MQQDTLEWILTTHIIRNEKKEKRNLIISFFHSILTLLAETKKREKKEKTNKQTNKMSDDNVLVV